MYFLFAPTPYKKVPPLIAHLPTPQLAVSGGGNIPAWGVGRWVVYGLVGGILRAREREREKVPFPAPW